MLSHFYSHNALIKKKGFFFLFVLWWMTRGFDTWIWHVDSRGIFHSSLPFGLCQRVFCSVKSSNKTNSTRQSLKKWVSFFLSTHKTMIMAFAYVLRYAKYSMLGSKYFSFFFKYLPETLKKNYCNSVSSHSRLSLMLLSYRQYPRYDGSLAIVKLMLIYVKPFQING